MTYEEFGIDKSKLKRDYLKNPLRWINKRKIELPIYEDFKYLYIDLNLSQTTVAQIFGLEKKATIYVWAKQFNLIKTQENMTKATANSMLHKYGVSNISSLESTKHKKEQTCLKNYGVLNPSQSNIIKQLKIDTTLKNYGTKYPAQNEDIKKRMIETNYMNHGGVFSTSTKECQEKTYQTKLSKRPNDPYNIKKIKETVQKKYGCDCVFQNEDIKKKMIETNLKKYNRPISSQAHLSDETYEIISNKTLLEQYIKNNNIINIKDLARKLHMSDCGAGLYVKKYNLNDMFDYSGSLTEKDIRDYINQFYKTIDNSKKYLDGKEIDIYIPELKLGIEFNGNFWHNEYGKTRLYHQEKSKLAEEKGIFIYHIFEYEWANKREQILNQLNNLLHINQQKIYARKCNIREVTNDEKSQFLETNHLQGNDNSSVKLGLYYENKLVSLMTFCKPRFNKNYEWELSRFCSLAGYNVIGGASKLFKHFIKTYNPKSIISYSNYAHTKGNLYQMLGFEFKELSSPNYVWAYNNLILSRYQCQKHKLLEQGFEGVSETDIMHKRGFYRIFDCGNKVWIWNR